MPSPATGARRAKLIVWQRVRSTRSSTRLLALSLELLCFSLWMSLTSTFVQHSDSFLTCLFCVCSEVSTKQKTGRLGREQHIPAQGDATQSQLEVGFSIPGAGASGLSSWPLWGEGQEGVRDPKSQTHSLCKALVPRPGEKPRLPECHHQTCSFLLRTPQECSK